MRARRASLFRAGFAADTNAPAPAPAPAAYRAERGRGPNPPAGRRLPEKKRVAGIFVSRILSPAVLPADQRPFLCRGSRDPRPRPKPGATYPGDISGAELRRPGRRPVLPVCLAPRRVCRAPGLAAGGGGLLPRLFTLTGNLRRLPAVCFL